MEPTDQAVTQAERDTQKAKTGAEAVGETAGSAGTNEQGSELVREREEESQGDDMEVEEEGEAGQHAELVGQLGTQIAVTKEMPGIEDVQMRWQTEAEGSASGEAGEDSEQQKAGDTDKEEEVGEKRPQKGVPMIDSEECRNQIVEESEQKKAERTQSTGNRYQKEDGRGQKEDGRDQSGESGGDRANSTQPHSSTPTEATRSSAADVDQPVDSSSERQCKRICEQTMGDPVCYYRACVFAGCIVSDVLLGYHRLAV